MSTSYPNTWDGVLEAARDAGAKFPELVAAQWALESGWGKHTSGQYNYFGLKGQGTNCVTQEVINGRAIVVTDAFINFESLAQCVEYLVSRWYLDWENYTGVNNAKSAEAAAKDLMEQGYATDPAYAEKLIKLMNDRAVQNKPKQNQQIEKPLFLFRITAMQNTWLKKDVAQSSELNLDAKKAVTSGKSYAVVAYQEVAGYGHAKVTLAAGSGDWYIYEPHWTKQQTTGEALPASVDWSDFNCLVTSNLTVGEILQWDVRRIPAKNDPVCEKLLLTAASFQQVRDAWGAPLGVTSFYRPEPINQAVGGVPGSRHTKGEAMDVYPITQDLDTFYQWIKTRWTGGLGDGRNRGFIHLDRRANGGFIAKGNVYPAVEWIY